MKPSTSNQEAEEKEDEACSSRSTADSYDGPGHAPAQLFSAFATVDVQRWEEGRFKYVKKLCASPRNQGVVQLMLDQVNNKLVAIKQMPNTWVQSCHADFLERHANETELPWQDIGCTQFLNSVNFEYACNLEGVFCSDEYTFVALTFASEGDLLGVARSGLAPGLEREAKYAQVVLQLLSGMKQLHDMHISHGDVSLENVLLTKKSGHDFEVKIIDYSMASTNRIFQNCVRGKDQYQAPEMHTQKAYDSFLADSFSVGVLLYTLFIKEYPWFFTKPGICKDFEYIQTRGFRRFIAKRKVRGTNDRVKNVLSDPLTQLLEGLLALDPNRRLTFGEDEWPGRRSVWDVPCMMQQDEGSRTSTKDHNQTLQEPQSQDSTDDKIPQERVASDAKMTPSTQRTPKKWLVEI